MERFETRKLLGAGLLLIAVSLGATACGDTSGSTPAPAESEEVEEPYVVSEYYDNGNRIIRYEADDDQYADIFAFCDGPDMVEQTELIGGWRSDSGMTGNSIVRTPNHAACEDGMLTEADFRIAG